MPKRLKTSQSALPAGYAPLLADLKARVRAAQVRAVLSVNRELVSLYWHIGREILRCQHDEGWGAKVVERLAEDLRMEFPEMLAFLAPTFSPCEHLPTYTRTTQSSNSLLDDCLGAIMFSYSQRSRIQSSDSGCTAGAGAWLVASRTRSSNRNRCPCAGS